MPTESTKANSFRMSNRLAHSQRGTITALSRAALSHALHNGSGLYRDRRVTLQTAQTRSPAPLIYRCSPEFARRQRPSPRP